MEGRKVDGRWVHLEGELAELSNALDAGVRLERGS